MIYQLLFDVAVSKFVCKLYISNFYDYSTKVGSFVNVMRWQ